MVNTRNEALRGVGRWCLGLERGLCPLPSIFLIFELKMASFGAFWEQILLQLNCLSYMHKPVSINFAW